MISVPSRARSFSRPLREYVQGALIAGTVIPLVLLAGINAYSRAAEQKEEMRLRLGTNAASVATDIDNYLDHHAAAIASYAALHPDSHTGLARHHAVYDGFITMLVADAGGRLIATSPARPLAAGGENIADREYFGAARQSGRPFISDVFKGRGFGHDAIVAISAPIHSPAGAFEGIVEGSLDLSKFRRFAAGDPGVHLLILDQRDRVIFSTNTRYAFLQALADSTLLARAHKAGAAVFHDEPTDTIVAQGLSAHQWRVFATRPMADLRRQETANITRTLFWLAGVVALSFILARALAARVTGPLSRLLERVRTLEPGLPTRPVFDDFSSAPREVERLAATFEQISTELSASYRQLREANEELEYRVDRRTQELARANRALEVENADRLRAQATLLLRDRAIAAANEGVIISDAATPGNPIIYANSGFEKITGYAAGHVLGSNCSFLQGPETDPATVDIIRAAIREGRECSVEILNYRKSGESFWNRLSITPVQDETGRVTHYVGVQSDITHRKQIEKLKTELVSAVSHELRTPLTSIRGFAELLLRNDYPRPRQLHFLGIVHREATRLGELINDFLDLQRVESGRLTYNFELLDVARLIDDTVRVFAESSSLHRLAIAVDPELPCVVADRARISQVLTNLIGNAVKFSPKGGAISVAAQLHGESVVCSVQDEGIGMTPDVLEQLFTRFFRADNSATRGIGGTGLGLELVKRIVEAHRGRIWVESTPGAGSVFRFSLPVTTN